MRRVASVLVVVLGVLAAGTPARADIPDPEQMACAQTGSDPSGTTFEVRGEPASTFVHRWDATGTRAWLCFRGAGAEGTSVGATWTSAWLTTDGTYTFQASYDFTNVTPAGEVSYLFEVRAQERGSPWESWFTPRTRSQGPLGGEGGGFGIGVVYDCFRPCPAQHLRWQLRLSVRFLAPASIDMQVGAKATS